MVVPCPDPASNGGRPVASTDQHSDLDEGGTPTRQVNRAAFRALAASMNWHDADIVDQAGGVR